MTRYRITWGRTGFLYVVAKSACEALRIARDTGISITREARAEAVSLRQYALQCRAAGMDVRGI